MAQGLFTPDQFTATQFDSAEVKAAFGNHFLHFVHSEFNRSLFRKAFYNRLSMCFSHIAHYNLAGFYDVWFTDDESRLNFLHHTLSSPCHGDPAYTYSDVEREIQRYILTTSLVRQYELRVAAAVRSREINQMEQLQAKYLASQPAANNISRMPVPAQRVPRLPIAESTSEPVQTSLF